MQPKPAGDERTTRTAVPAEAPELPVAVVRPPPSATPALVLRPQFFWRAVSPGLILFALAVVAAGRLRAVPVALVLVALGAAFLPAWWDRLDIGTHAIVRRTWRGRRTIAVEDIDTMGLRRVPFRLLRFLSRGYKFGRYWSIPLTLRLLGEDATLLELRCVWWRNWRELTRYIVATMPDLELDGRTRGRLERYVGLGVASPSQR